MPNIVVLGAGVSGLTTALLLAKLGEHNITVVAKHMPGDYDIEYTSPWAGANVMPMADEPDNRWERDTWPEIKRLAAEVPEAGIHFQKALLLRREKDTAAGRITKMHGSNPWFRSLFDDFRELDPSELPAGMDQGTEYTSVCINTALYLGWLVGQCRAHGVVLKRAVIQHIAEAAAYSGTATTANLVINASGLLASRLGGVADADVVPIRGQTVLIRDELETMLSTSGTDDGDGDEICYTMMRASGGGTILGGTYQVGNWDANPDPNQAVRIMARAVAHHPQLKGKQVQDLSIIRHGVGLRPYRKGGIRLEKEKMADGLWVVHNYGHSGYGYQTSYGCASRVLELVAEVLAEKS